MSEDESLTENQKNYIAQQKEEEVFKLNAANEIKNNAQFQDFFSKYSTDNVNSFIDGFVNTKLIYTKYAHLYEEEADRASIGMLPEAKECLRIIQQRKLFDAQCFWRAGKLIDTKYIELGVDFNYWQEYVFACPFIDPISEADIDLYIQFLNSSYSDSGCYYSYQDYDEMKEALEKGEEDGVYPEWYEFHDTYRGTGMNIKLPDIKTPQEDFYIEIYFEDERRKKQEANISDTIYSPSPFISPYNQNDLKAFIGKFYDSQEMELWKNYNDSKRNAVDGLDEAFALLSEARELIPIQSHHNWQEAVLEAAQLYRNRLIASAIPIAYQEYLMKIDSGISFYDEVKNRQDADLHEIVKKQIIKGRILNDEPPDLNFRE